MISEICKMRDKMLNPELQIFSDTLIIEALLADRFYKYAQDGFVPGLINSVKDYAVSHIDPNNKVSSVLNLLAPGILTAFGYPWLAVIYELSESLFGINLSSIFSTIKSGISSLISNGKQTDSNSVSSVISGALSHIWSDSSNLDDHAVAMSLREIQLLKIALDNFVSKYPNFSTVKPRVQIKYAAGLFGLTKAKVGKLLFAAIKWIVVVLLASAGFMVAKDAVHGLIGSFMGGSTESKQPEKSNLSESTAPIQNTTQNIESTILQVNPSYISENFNNGLSSWTIPGNTNSIDPTFVAWAVEIYPQLKKYENLIRSTNGFRQLVASVKSYNDGNNLGFVSIPKQYKSRKQIVDVFVSEIQQKLTEMAGKSQK